MVNHKKGNQYSKKIPVELFDKKGHRLRTVGYRPTIQGSSLRILNDVMYCPICKIFFKARLNKVKVVIQ